MCARARERKGRVPKAEERALRCSKREVPPPLLRGERALCAARLRAKRGGCVGRGARAGEGSAISGGRVWPPSLPCISPFPLSHLSPPRGHNFANTKGWTHISSGGHWRRMCRCHKRYRRRCRARRRGGGRWVGRSDAKEEAPAPAPAPAPAAPFHDDSTSAAAALRRGEMTSVPAGPAPHLHRGDRVAPTHPAPAGGVDDGAAHRPTADTVT